MPNYPCLNLMVVGLLLIAAAPTRSTPASANPLPVKKSARINRPTRKVLFVPPLNDQRPEGTVGAGTRNGENCSSSAAAPPNANAPLTQLPFMAIVPPSRRGTTLAAHPSFWIYLPDTAARQVVLSLKEDGIKPHSQTVFAIAGTSGLIGLKPSESSPPLEIGKTYQWAAVLICSDRPSPNDPAVVAWVNRVPSVEPIQRGTPLAQASWYAEHGIWYDAVATLGQMQQENPENTKIKAVWSDFLKSAGLESVPTETFQNYALSAVSP